MDFGAISWILARFRGFWLDFVDFGAILRFGGAFCDSAEHLAFRSGDFAIRRSTWRFDLVILRFGGAFWLRRSILRFGVALSICRKQFAFFFDSLRFCRTVSDFFWQFAISAST